MFLLFRISGKVRVRRSLTGNWLVWVWAVLPLGFSPGKREAVWPSSPMPRRQRSRCSGSSLAYFSSASLIGREVSK